MISKAARFRALLDARDAAAKDFHAHLTPCRQNGEDSDSDDFCEEIPDCEPTYCQEGESLRKILFDAAAVVPSTADVLEALEAAERRLPEIAGDKSTLARFAAHQAARDRVKERQDYVSATVLRLTDSHGEPIITWPLGDIPTYPDESMPYSVVWEGKHYRLNAIVPGEIWCCEITDADVLRDYERAEPPYQIVVEPKVRP